MGKKIVFILGVTLLALFVIASIFPSFIAKYNPKFMAEPWLKPSKEHLLGTNKLGYDIFSELVYATRKTLITGISASILALVLATIFGALAIESKVCKSVIDTMILLPRLIVMIVLASFLKVSNYSLIIIIAIFSFSTSARAIVARVRMMKNECFIESLTVQGFSKAHILIYHIIPSLRDVLLTRFLLGINSAIMMESTLSFLGFGDIYDPTWGTMVNLAYKNGAFLRHSYNYLLSPGLAIMLLSLSFYMISLGFEVRHEEIKEVK